MGMGILVALQALAVVAEEEAVELQLLMVVLVLQQQVVPEVLVTAVTAADQPATAQLAEPAVREVTALHLVQEVEVVILFPALAVTAVRVLLANSGTLLTVLGVAVEEPEIRVHLEALEASMAAVAEVAQHVILPVVAGAPAV